MTKPADSKQAIPSPEDRVRAIREREQKATKGPWEVVAADDYYISAEAYPVQDRARYVHDNTDKALAMVGNQTEDCGEANSKFIANARADIPYLLSLVEELKGQVAAKEKERGQWQALFMESEEYNCSCNIADTAKPVGDPMNYVCDWHERHPDITKARNETFPLVWRAETAEAEADLLRKRKDYHAEYVEAVEAKREMDWVLMENESPKETAWYWTFPRNDDDPLTGTSLPYALRYYMANEHGNNFMNNKPMRGWCAKGPITHWLRLPIPPLAALTPEPATKAEVQP